MPIRDVSQPRAPSRQKKPITPKTQVPPIKCQGIKTKLVPWIKTLIPAEFKGVWVEPFMGSGVVAFNVRPAKAILADTNPHLIAFYQALNQHTITATTVQRFLEKEGALLAHSEGEHYYTVRARFNQMHDPLDFLFLNRACFNGLMRFNRKGGFNVPFCRKPTRFTPALITKITNQVRAITAVLSAGHYTFCLQPFSETLKNVAATDVVYCDPPYQGRHADYFNGWSATDEAALATTLLSAPCPFIVSTWHHNDFRHNKAIESLWSDCAILTREHFYHVGATVANRNPMTEALVTNLAITPST